MYFLNETRKCLFNSQVLVFTVFSYLSDVRYNLDLVVFIDFTSLEFTAETGGWSTAFRSQIKLFTRRF